MCALLCVTQFEIYFQDTNFFMGPMSFSVVLDLQTCAPVGTLSLFRDAEHMKMTYLDLEPQVVGYVY
jgi:hypothetical protein